MKQQELIKRYHFILEDLNCANCASKIEEALKAREEFSKVQFSFATKKLQLIPSETFIEEEPLTSEKELTEKLTTLVQDQCDVIEDGVHVIYVQTGVPTMVRSHQSHEGNRSGDFQQSHDLHHSQHSHSGTSITYNVVEAVMALAILLIVSLTSFVKEPFDTYLTILAFVGIGRYVFVAAFKNAFKGRFMDENFLMTVAVLGAIAIGDYHEALGVMIFYRIGVLFEEKATERSRTEIMSVIDMRPETVMLVDESGFKKEIPAAEAQVGQIVQVRAGDRIPLDGTIVSGASRIDTSPVTGEPKPINAEEGTAVLSGCINLSGTLHICVDQPLEESFVTKILNAVETATANKPSVDRFITRFAKYYTPTILIVTALTILIPSMMTGQWEYWIYTGLTFLVVSCPCALVLSVPLAFFAGIGGSSKQGILFKGGLSMENMKTVKVIALDKTGTLTEGKFAVQTIEAAQGFKGEDVLALAASIEELSSHPIALSIRDKADMLQLKVAEAVNGEEFAGEGLRATVEGREVICGNRRLFDRLGLAISSEGSLVPGASEVFVAIDGSYAGRIVIRDILKRDAFEAVRALQKAGYIVAMVTGDAKESAQVVAKEAGITHVYAGLMPTEKLAVLEDLRSQYGSIMFVGDGINDAPVLAGANVGCAMGSGADAALEAADVVFMNSEVLAVEKSIYMAKKTMSVAWQNVFMAIVIKAIVMVAGFMGFASLWLAIFADTGVMVICVLNAIRLLYSASKNGNFMTPSSCEEDVSLKNEKLA